MLRTMTRKVPALALLAIGLTAATGARGACPDGVALLLNEDAHHGYRLDGDFTANIPRTVAWGVLTDYDEIDRFVSSIRLSAVLGRESTEVMVEQVAEARLLMFTRPIHLMLRV